MEFSSEDFLEGLWGESKSKWVKWIHRNISDNHCSECLMLDNCWFLRAKTPPWPHHKFCHCVLEPLSQNIVAKNALAKSDYSKFDPYLFNRDGKYPHNKEKLFNSWGYTIDDAKWLQKEIEEQALQKYINSEYNLGLLNSYGQRISIRIEISRKDNGEVVSFTTGWTVLPNGQIKLNTPYGGK